MRFVITLLALVGLSVADVGAESIDVQAFYPSGGQRGTSVEVRVIGKTSHWPVGTWTSSPGIQVEAVPEKEQTLKVSIADNARPGIHWLRLHHELGAARLRPFIVETVREVMESSDADGPSQIDVTEPHIVNGRLTKNDEVDQYKVQLTQGQRLVAVLHAHRPLGSPMDAVMQIVDAEHQVILQQEDDTPGRDPRIVFTAPRDGDYVIRLFAFPETPTSRIGFAGAENFVYRLALSTAGYIDHAYPLAISKGQLDRVIAVGWGLPTSELQRIRRQEHDLTEFTLFHSGTPGWAPVRQLEVDCVCEQSDFSTASPSE